MNRLHNRVDRLERNRGPEAELPRIIFLVPVGSSGRGSQEPKVALLINGREDTIQREKGESVEAFSERAEEMLHQPSMIPEAKVRSEQLSGDENER